MMRLASTRSSVASATPGIGLLLRMRAWFARSIASTAAKPYVSHEVAHDGVASRAVPAMTQHVGTQPALALHNGPTAVLLPFPIRGEALLVRLADQLRGRVAGSVITRDSFILTVSRRPYSRLTIDSAAHIEFLAETALYRSVIGVEQDTRIIVETSNFDTVVKFTAQYVADRLSGDIAGKIAS